MIRDDDKPAPYDVELEEVPSSTPFGAPVIDFGGVRVAFGLRRYHHRSCEHKSLRYSPEERRIWCVDCERTIESFDAFMTLVKHWHEMERAARAKYMDADEAKKAVLIRRRAKEIDREWGRKMAPQCSGCGRGLMPDDNAGWVGFAYELARRNKK